MKNTHPQPDAVSAFADLRITLDLGSARFFRSTAGGTDDPTPIPSQLLIEKISEGQAIRLNNPFEHRARLVFHLLHWLPTDDFFVSTSQLTTEEGEPPRAVLREVIPHREFEQHRGRVDTKQFLRGAKHSFEGSDDAYTAWRKKFLMFHDPIFYREMKLRKIEVAIMCAGLNEGDAPERHSLGSPRIPHHFLIAEGVQNAHKHPDFWPWFHDRVRDRGRKFAHTFARATAVYLEILDEPPIQIYQPLTGPA